MGRPRSCHSGQVSLCQISFFLTNSHGSRGSSVSNLRFYSGKGTCTCKDTESCPKQVLSHTRVGMFSNACFQIYQSCDQTMLIMLCSMEGWMSIENSAPIGSELHVPRPQGDGSRVHTMHCPQDSRQEAGFHLCPSRSTGNQFSPFTMQAH